MLQGFWSLLRFHGFHMLMIIFRKIVLSISYLATWYHYDIICCDHYFIFTGTWLAHVSPREQYTQPRADIDESRAVQPTMDHRSVGGHASAPTDPTISCCDFHVVTYRRRNLYIWVFVLLEFPWNSSGRPWSLGSWPMCWTSSRPQNAAYRKKRDERSWRDWYLDVSKSTGGMTG